MSWAFSMLLGVVRIVRCDCGLLYLPSRKGDLLATSQKGPRVNTDQSTWEDSVALGAFGMLVFRVWGPYMVVFRAAPSSVLESCLVVMLREPCCTAY